MVYSRWIGLIGLMLFLLVALFAPFIAPYSPNAFSGTPLEVPGSEHYLGTNSVGQDIFSQMIYGTRISLFLGITVSLFATIIGAGYGIAAGFCGRLTDRVLMRGLDIFLTIPHLPLMLLLAAYFPPVLSTTLFILVLFSWPGEAKLIRAQVLSLKKREYLEAAKMAGAGNFYLIWRYLLPELLPLLLSQFILRSSWAVLAESGLAFLGLGDPALKSWGMILQEALAYDTIYFTPAWRWWLLPPGICITCLIFSFTFLGYALEEKYQKSEGDGL